jgi:serine/threonine protein kinase
MDQKSLIGKLIGNYRIKAEINSGGFGSIYVAEHEHLSGRVVAIKLLHIYLNSAQERDQFVQEAQFLSMLEHPFILPLIDFGFSDGRAYLIAKYAGGGSLRDLLNRSVLLPLTAVVSILMQIGQALSYAHNRNIIHRDLKPENILFDAQGKVLLCDFGIATMLSSASVKNLSIVSGTPPYMAPEQFRGTASKESDQYALGCIAYEMLTGRRPFSAPDFVAMGFKHLTESPVPPTRYNPHLAPAIEAAVLKAMAKRREERHPSVLAFLAALSEPFNQVTALATQQHYYTSEQWLDAAQQHYQAGRYYEALQAYEQALQLDPHDIDTYYNMGLTLLELKRYEEAISVFEQTLQLDPTYAGAYFNKGVALGELRQPDEALVAFNLAWQLDPGYIATYGNKGLALYELQRYDEVISVSEEALQIDPDYALAYDNKGRALYKLKYYEEALSAFARAIVLDPDDSLTYLNLGNTLFALQRYSEALAAYQKALQLDPNFGSAYLNKGKALEQLGRASEAQEARNVARRLLSHSMF